MKWIFVHLVILSVVTAQTVVNAPETLQGLSYESSLYLSGPSLAGSELNASVAYLPNIVTESSVLCSGDTQPALREAFEAVQSPVVLVTWTIRGCFPEQAANAAASAGFEALLLFTNFSSPWTSISIWSSNSAVIPKTILQI